jgi:predicted alpha/beta hydrolase
MNKPEQQSLYVHDNSHQLHVRHIFLPQQSRGQPVLMVHGAIENGRIFYSHNNKGLGCYLAARGFDVYVVDLRGRGETIPKIQPFDCYGQTETIVHDLPLFIDFVYRQNPQPMHLIGHSWGGVLLTAMLARSPHYLSKVRSKIFFGSKRQVKVINPEVLMKIILMWQWLAPLVAKHKGFLPAKSVGFGSDDETIKSHRQNMHWTKTADWIDSDDGFDYAHACQQVAWPPSWFIAAVSDKALGHPKDIQRFMQEANHREAKYTLLA